MVAKNHSPAKANSIKLSEKAPDGKFTQLNVNGLILRIPGPSWEPAQFQARIKSEVLPGYSLRVWYPEMTKAFWPINVSQVSEHHFVINIHSIQPRPRTENGTPVGESQFIPDSKRLWGNLQSVQPNLRSYRSEFPNLLRVGTYRPVLDSNGNMGRANTYLDDGMHGYSVFARCNDIDCAVHVYMEKLQIEYFMRLPAVGISSLQKSIEAVNHMIDFWTK